MAFKKQHIESTEKNQTIFQEKTKKARNSRARDGEKGKIEGFISTGSIGTEEKKVRFHEIVDI